MSNKTNSSLYHSCDRSDLDKGMKGNAEVDGLLLEDVMKNQEVEESTVKKSNYLKQREACTA